MVASIGVAVASLAVALIALLVGADSAPYTSVIGFLVGTFAALFFLFVAWPITAMFRAARQSEYLRGRRRRQAREQFLQERARPALADPGDT